MVISDCPGTSMFKVALDIVGPMPKTKDGHEYILTMQDQLSKFCMSVCLKTMTAQDVADAFIKKWICVFGAPRIILTDQAQNFLSKLLQRIAKRFKIKQIRTTAFHPQSNASLERSHISISEFLKQYANKDQEWDQCVDIAMLNYNSCIQESTKHTPFEVMFGKLPRLPSSEPLREIDLVLTYQGYITNLVVRLHGIRKLVYDNLVESKNRNIRYYDKHINPRNFNVGDYVFLLSEPKPKKLGNHYSGPHEILEIIGPTNVKIEIGKNHKIVHANRLRISHIDD